jgi:uncharacterized protein
MKSLALLIPFLLIQPTSLQAETVPQHKPTASSKPNSSNVPDAYALSGHFDRVVVMRMKFKTDLLAGMEQMVKQQHIVNGVILSGIGSVRGYHIHQVRTRDFPSLDAHENEPEAPADLVSMNGYIIHGNIHAHVTLGTGTKTVSGHLDSGTEVFTSAIISVGVMNGTDLSKVDDEEYR